MSDVPLDAIRERVAAKANDLSLTNAELDCEVLLRLVDQLTAENERLEKLARARYESMCRCDRHVVQQQEEIARLRAEVRRCAEKLRECGNEEPLVVAAALDRLVEPSQKEREG